MNYRRDIDGLRAFSVLPVILFHTKIACPGGFVGVDVFFVISGYLIAGMVYRDVVAGTFTFTDFYQRRIRRLFPALSVMLLATTLWAVDRMLFADLRAFGKSLIATVVYLSNVYFSFRTGYFAEETTIMPLLHTWSLAVEEQFYLAAPLMVLGLVAWVPQRLRVGATASVVVLSFVYCTIITRQDPASAFYSAPARAWELGIGVLLALAGTRWISTRRWLAEVLGLAGLGCIAFAVFTFKYYLPFPGWYATVPCLGAGAVIASGLVPGTLTARFLSLGPLVFIGKISYPLYLWHWPVIVMFFYGPLDPLTTFDVVQVLVITFVLSVLTWHFVEKPIRTRRALVTTRRMFLSAGVMSAATIVAGLTLVVTDGLPARHDPTLIALVAEKGLLDNKRWLHDHHADCGLLLPELLRTGKVCVLGADGVAPTFILVGDSHADAISPAIFAAARQLGRSGYHFASPGFLPTPGRQILNLDNTELLNDFDMFLKDRPTIDTVIVTAWWSRARTGESYRDDRIVYVDDNYDGSGAAYDAKSFDAALERLVRTFPERNFVFLDDGPSGRKLDMKSYVRSYAVSGRPPVAALPTEVAALQRASYEPTLQALARHHPNVSYAPVFGKLCGKSSCALFNADGQPIFRDGHHLSNVGALSLTADIVRVLSVAFGLKETNQVAETH